MRIGALNQSMHIVNWLYKPIESCLLFHWTGARPASREEASHSQGHRSELVRVGLGLLRLNLFVLRLNRVGLPIWRLRLLVSSLIGLSSFELRSPCWFVWNSSLSLFPHVRVIKRSPSSLGDCETMFFGEECRINLIGFRLES